MKKKIVYITTLLPYPPDMGGKIKTLSTLRQLVRVADVYLFSFVDKEEDLVYEKDLLKIGIKECFTVLHPVIAEKHRMTQFLILLKSLFTTKPYSVYKYYSKEMVKLLNGFMAVNKIDIFWVDHTIQTQYLPTGNPIQDRTPVETILDRRDSSEVEDVYCEYKKILETHNFKTDFFRQMFLAETKVFWKLFSLYEWLKFRFYEPRELKRFDRTYTISTEENNKITRFNKNCQVLMPYIEPTENHGNFKNKRLFFVGLMTWYPNKQGVTWFIKEVFPELKIKLPDLTFDIVGDYFSKWKRPEIAGVKYYGYQKDLNRFWRGASVFVVPLIYGSGIRIKILEALANGIPVVSTLKGAEGLPESISKSILIATDREEFVNKIQVLFKSDELYKKYIVNGQKAIKRMNFLKRLNLLEGLTS